MRGKDLEAEMGQSAFWNEPEKAKAVIEEVNALKVSLADYYEIRDRLNDAAELIELGGETGDSEIASELTGEIAALGKKLEKLEIDVLLNGKYDRNNAILSLHAGAGGTEAQDWVSMLLRMYSRWAEASGFKVQITDLLADAEAGIKSATAIISGATAYGRLKSEKGVHRLVRISPFDANRRRHTSFASVDVIPEIDDDITVVIDPGDLRIDTYRASGAGGQHVNKTDSAVRITHLPTGIVVECQNERSQFSNKDTAMKILRARLFERQRQEQAKEMAELRGEYQGIAWGSQIRSYVFQPYSLIKDHRTDVEVGNVSAVMDGDIDQFIYAYLRKLVRDNAKK
jgi:peptide chain release factor 2